VIDHGKAEERVSKSLGILEHDTCGKGFVFYKFVVHEGRVREPLIGNEVRGKYLLQPIA
jgi:hypothetical protein